MTFDIDTFESGDFSGDRTVSQAVRKLLRRGYGVAGVNAGPVDQGSFPWGWGSKGVRSVRTWNVAIAGAPEAPDFEGVLAIRETTMDYDATDPRDVGAAPVSRWFEFLPDGAGTAKVLKANDGY